MYWVVDRISSTMKTKMKLVLETSVFKSADGYVLCHFSECFLIIKKKLQQPDPEN